MFVGFDKFLTKEAYQHIFFGYMNCLRYNLPTISIEKGIQNFMKYHNLNDDNFNAESAKVTYYRMIKEFTNMQKES